MARSKYFIPMKYIKEIVKMYGGFRKWNSFERASDYRSIVLTDKKDRSLWFVIEKSDSGIQVHFTDCTGIITKCENLRIKDGNILKVD